MRGVYPNSVAKLFTTIFQKDLIEVWMVEYTNYILRSIRTKSIWIMTVHLISHCYLGISDCLNVVSISQVNSWESIVVWRGKLLSIGNQIWSSWRYNNTVTLSFIIFGPDKRSSEGSAVCIACPSTNKKVGPICCHTSET